MRQFALLTALCALTGCGVVEDIVDEVTISSAEMEEIADNIRCAIDAYEDLSDFALQVARGDIEISGQDFTEPTADNDFTSTLIYNGDEFPGGSGEITMTFRVLADGVVVDPVDFDLASADVLQIQITMDFNGSNRKGDPMTFVSDFDMDVDTTAAESETVTVNGTFDIQQNGYRAQLTASDFAWTTDLASGLPSNATGTVAGPVSIPDFAFDGDLLIEGRDEQVRVKIEVLDQTVEDALIDLTDF